MHCPLLLQDAIYAPYDAEIDFLQDQISVLSDEIAERDRHIESLKSERASVGYEAAGFTGRGSRASSMAPSEDGADRDVELQVNQSLCFASHPHAQHPTSMHRVCSLSWSYLLPQ